MKKNSELINSAKSALKNAYAPYSKHKVCAAVLCPKGKVYTGVNVENASYGLTICAERNAVFSAVSNGETKILSIAVWTSGKQYPYPCGACLQVLSEFGKNIKIIIGKPKSPAKINNISKLLATPFKFKK